MMTLFITRLHRSINNNNHFWLYLLLCFAGQKITTTYAQNLEQWSYTNTITRENGNNVYGPSDWLKVKCNDLDTCTGWADKVPNSQGWSVGTTNHCIWCPAGKKSCGAHHSSPINLDRNLNVVGSPIYNECIDGHWMAYFDSSCAYDELRELNAFTIERYGLKIVQPISETRTSGNFYGIACSQQPNIGRRWGRVDFPKGYSQWWLLSHIDFHVPSEHTQNGKRYSAELQLHHYYSVTAEEAGIDNELAAISVFMEAYDDAVDWPILNKVICAWREAEEKNRRACGLPSVLTSYPGCFPYSRGSSTVGSSPPVSEAGQEVTNTTTTNGTIATQGIRRRDTMKEDELSSFSYKPATSAYDIILENYHHMSIGNTSYVPKKIQIEEENSESMNDFDWNEFIQQSYIDEENHIQAEEERQSMYYDGASESIYYDESSQISDQNSRHLMDYGHISWYNYFPMVGVKTEYFYRYSGTQTTPPCYGRFISGSRAQTLHWRVMKDPIRVSHRQIAEMHRLIKERIAPKDAPINSCKPDTGAAPNPNGNPNEIWAARPLQEFSSPHWAVFCDCASWGSKFEEDQKWCRIFQNDQQNRYFTHPYNFPTIGF